MNREGLPSRQGHAAPGSKSRSWRGSGHETEVYAAKTYCTSRERKMNPLRKIIDGATDNDVYRRVGWMYVSFFILYVAATVISFCLLPEGFLRGKHPIIRRLEFSPDLWASALLIFGYNLVPTFLILGASLLAQQSRLSRERFVPIGYTAFWGLAVLFGVVVGTWSFELVTPAPPLFHRFVRLFDVLHHAGLLEFSAYLLVAAVSYKFTLWYSDGRKIVASRTWKDITLGRSEKVLFALAFALLLCAALVESYGIVHLTG
jgi:hypothetical protein